MLNNVWKCQKVSSGSNGLVGRVKKRARQAISAWGGETRKAGETAVIHNAPDGKHSHVHDCCLTSSF